MEMVAEIWRAIPMPEKAPSGLASLTSVAPMDSLAAQRPGTAAALLGLFAFASCYFRSFAFAHLPFMPGGDQIGFFTSGSRMVAGQLPYRDFFEILPVGTDLTYAALIKLFGFCTWVPGAVMAFLAAGIVILITLAAARIMRGLAIVIPGLLLLGFLLLDESLNATHHWFCTLAAMAAMFVLLRDVSLPRVAAAGALAGLATSFTQTTGAFLVVGLAIYVAWKSKRTRAGASWRKPLLLCAVAIAVFFAINGYFIWQAGLREWIFDAIVFPVRYFTVPAVNNWRVIEYDFGWHPSLRRWISFPFLYATVPLVYVICLFLTYWRSDADDDQNERWDALILISLTGLSMFLAAAPAPSFLRVSSASPAAMVLLVWLLARSGAFTRKLNLALGAIALLLAIAVPLNRQLHSHATLDLPAGRTAFLDPLQYDEHRWLLARTHPGKYFYGMPPLFLPFHLVNPAPVAGLDTTAYTRPDQVTASLQALQDHPPPMIILRGPLEHSTSPATDYTEPFRQYMRANYVITKTFPNGDVVWERRNRPPGN
jgi:hypothetical protein